MNKDKNIKTIMTSAAPIVLFVYNRPRHTQKTIEALQKNELADQSDLIIYSDAAKNDQAMLQVQAVRDYIKTVIGFKSVNIIERQKNWGLAANIIDGVGDVLNKYGKIIVMEDDLVTSKYFLKFMNDGLEKYKTEKKIYSITGYSFTSDIPNIDSTYFLSITSSWSWATWADKWKVFERNPEKLKQLIKNKSVHEKFNFDGSYDFISMAKDSLRGKNDSWAIYWYFSVYKNDGLTLYPSKSLVSNIGFDGSGVHCGNTGSDVLTVGSHMPILTDNIIERIENRSNVSNIFRQQNVSIFTRAYKKCKYLLKSKLSALTIIRLLQIKDRIKIFSLNKDIGINTYIDKTVHVTGWNSISIGNNSAISEYTWINVNNRVPNHKHIVIGDNCYIGRRNFFSSGLLIEVGDFVMTGLDCKFMGSDHVFTSPMNPYIGTGTTNDKTIKLGTNVWLGADVKVLGHVTIGHGSIIGAGSLVNKSIPPFSIAVGNPCKVIKRYDFKIDQWVNINEFDNSSIVLMPDESKYRDALKSNKIPIMPLQACSKSFGDMF